jgi:hypothetical protein
MEFDATELTDPKEIKFERGYTRKFLDLSGEEGVAIKYENDVAALDLGLHLTAGDIVTNTRVWFQLKGIHASTLPLEEFNRQSFASRQVKIKHLRAWYKSAEPVYLVYYVESADLFLANDIKDIVERNWGDELLNPALFEDEDSEIPVNISLDSQVNDAFWKRLYGHRSMRIDSRSFRGRPLGHDHDPLTTTLRVMEPGLFKELTDDLLSEHGYEIKGHLDGTQLFPGARAVGNEATITYGVLKEKYEIILQITNEFLPDEEGFKIEGKSDYAFGPCAVVIHSKVATPPDPTAVIAIARELQTKGITRLLVFINGYMLTENLQGCCFYEYRQAQIGAGTECMPQHLEDIGFSVCIATNTYYRFRDRLSWWGKALWSKEKGASLISS